MANGRKVRCDRWDTGLTDEQVWRAYDVFRRSCWAEFQAWAEKELADVRIPSRNSMYEWERDLREKEAAHRLRQAAAARDEVGALAETASLDATLVAAYKSMAAKAALLGDKGSAVALTKMALGIAGTQLDAEKVRLQRDKFDSAERRLQAVREALSAPKGKDGGLSPETLDKIEKAAGLL
jgi:hypothetical protein